MKQIKTFKINASRSDFAEEDEKEMNDFLANKNIEILDIKTTIDNDYCIYILIIYEKIENKQVKNF